MTSHMVEEEDEWLKKALWCGAYLLEAQLSPLGRALGEENFRPPAVRRGVALKSGPVQPVGLQVGLPTPNF